MTNDISRRRFLESMAALAGVQLLGGCSDPGSAEGGTEGGIPGKPVAAKPGDAGTLTVPGAGSLKAGQAQVFTFPDGKPGIVFVTSAGLGGALSATCTHAGCIVEWRPRAGADKLHCPCHDSSFEPNGAVLGGPAKKPLTQFDVKVKGQDAILTPV